MNYIIKVLLPTIIVGVIAYREVWWVVVALFILYLFTHLLEIEDKL